MNEPKIKQERDEEDKEFLEFSYQQVKKWCEDDDILYDISDLKEIFNQDE